MKPPANLPDDLIEIRDSGIHGLGAFARRGIARGERIGNYAGRRYTARQVAARDWNSALTYVFALSDGSVIDASEGGNATRHINHACAPNCVAWEVEDDDGTPQIVIEAKRRIRKGEELFLDYALDVGDNDPEAFVCRCGHARCRGTMAGAG